MSDVMDTGPGTVSVKFGPGYEAPLFVARGTVQDMGTQLIEAFGITYEQGDTLAMLVAKASATATGLQVAHQPTANGGLGGQSLGEDPAPKGWGSSGNAGSGGQDNVQQSQPQGGQGGSPGGNCPHGARVWKQGTSKSGKAYKGWFCPSNVNGCTPQWA